MFIVYYVLKPIQYLISLFFRSSFKRTVRHFDRAPGAAAGGARESGQSVLQASNAYSQPIETYWRQLSDKYKSLYIYVTTHNPHQLMAYTH